MDYCIGERESGSGFRIDRTHQTCPELLFHDMLETLSHVPRASRRRHDTRVLWRAISINGSILSRRSDLTGVLRVGDFILEAGER